MSRDDAARAGIMARARASGFDLVGVARPELPPRYGEAFARWIADGCHGEMAFLADRVARGVGPDHLLEGVRSVVVLAIGYRPAQDQPGPVARYARGRDYHKVLGAMLRPLVREVGERWGGRARAFVDTGPLSERAYAEMAGLGRIGRNSCLITPTFGSWVLLAVMLTDLDLEPDTNGLPALDCAACKRCIEACPAAAIRSDRTVDARRCVSYLTIENRGAIPEPLRPACGKQVFGCDRCQEVCPHNREAGSATVPRLVPRLDPDATHLEKLLAISDHESLTLAFAGTPLMRAKRFGIVRNAIVAAGNRRDNRLRPELERIAATDPDPALRQHATWALEAMAQ